MGRKRRPYQPGGIFHLTARTLRQERRFTPPLRTAALNALARALPRSRARLLAVAIMSNHLHLVVQQGDRPLSWLMQALLRRLALILQNAHGVEGPMFWRPYGSQACLNPKHARNAIIYTHLNPVRAGICGDPADYPWSSHALYAAAGSAPVSPRLRRVAGLLDPSIALPLFATEPGRTGSQLREDYLSCVQLRMAADAALESRDTAPGDAVNRGDPSADVPGWAAPSAWRLAPGWGDALSPLFHAPGASVPGGPESPARPAAPDLDTLARIVLAAEAPELTPDDVRGRRGGRQRSGIRHAIIRRAHAARFRNVDIARYLDLSESAVSKVVCAR